jgi:DNA-binding CsgD family transcriptional regulator
VLATLVAALVERADLDGAEAELAARGASSGEPRTHATRWLLLQSRARLRRAQGRFAEAMEDVGRADRERSSAYGVSLLGRAELALGLHATGEHAEACRIAADAVRRATAWEVPSTLGMTLRVQGLVEGGERGVALLARAAEVLADAPRRLEYARAVVDLGAALRRANRRSQAREPLERGMEIAHRCAAIATVERAHAELLACGARPRRPVRTGVEALTPSELRVARLAASGLTNREIAQALFVTRPTVTTHLGAVYRKLDVNAREQLAALLDPGTKDHHPPSDAKAPGGPEAVVP